jgi:hypothetical protein
METKPPKGPKPPPPPEKSQEPPAYLELVEMMELFLIECEHYEARADD